LSLTTMAARFLPAVDVFWSVVSHLFCIQYCTVLVYRLRPWLLLLLFYEVCSGYPGVLQFYLHTFQSRLKSACSVSMFKVSLNFSCRPSSINTWCLVCSFPKLPAGWGILCPRRSGRR
jgi:hypothetical protein